MRLQQKSFLMILILFLFATVSFTQEKQINDLKELLKNESLSDSIKIKYFGDLGWYFSSFSSDSAFKYSKLALKLSNKTNNIKGIAQAYNDIGIIHYRISQFDSSLVYYKKSLQIRKKEKDSLGIASIYNKMGISHNQLFKLDSAIYYALASIKIYKNKNKPKLVAMNLNNVANLYKDSKQYQKALKKHKETLHIRKQLNDSVGYVYSYNGLADIYTFLKKTDSSKYYYNKALPIAIKLNLKNELSTIQNNLGILYQNEGNINKAYELYKSSLEIRQSIQDNYGIISSYINLASINILRENFKIAEKQLYFALNETRKINAQEQLIYIYKGLISVKGNIAEPDSLAFYFKKYDQIKDSLYNKQVIEKLTDIEAKYKNAEKEIEIVQQKEQLLQQELKLKNRNFFAFILASALIILTIVFLGIYKKNQFIRKQLQKEIDLKDALATIKMQNRLQDQRLKISRDLHDNIGSQLTFIISSIDNLKFISKDLNVQLKEKLSSISSFTSETIFQLRDTIWAMNKTEISVEDLHARVLSFVEKAKLAVPKTKFEVAYEIDANKSFSSLKGMNIFRVIQEAINNAIKYADAKKIIVHISKKEENFVVSIVDDGKGFDPKTANLGNGLYNMEKRMSQINGRIKITSEKNKGTEINLSLLLKNTADDV
jgi:signal transduction histidine kinase